MAITPVTQPSSSLANARIGYENLLVNATGDNGSEVAMLIPNTWERYRPTSGAKTVKFQMTSASIDFVGIAAHNAGTQDGGVNITVGYAVTVGGAVTTLSTMQSNDSNGALMILFDAVTAQEIIITFNAATDGLELGVIYAGKVLEMPHGLWGGHAPIELQAQTKYANPVSVSGQFLGRNITRQGIETKYEWRHLDPAWVRSTFTPFIKAARVAPFFIMWRPDTYETAAYGYTTGDINPTNMSGASRLMTAGFTLKGHQDTN